MNLLKPDNAVKENGNAKVNSALLIHQAPHSWGFLFAGGWVDLIYMKDKFGIFSNPVPVSKDEKKTRIKTIWESLHQ